MSSLSTYVPPTPSQGITLPLVEQVRLWGPYLLFAAFLVVVQGQITPPDPSSTYLSSNSHHQAHLALRPKQEACLPLPFIPGPIRVLSYVGLFIMIDEGSLPIPFVSCVPSSAGSRTQHTAPRGESCGSSLIVEAGKRDFCDTSNPGACLLLAALFPF